jgi:hypothetical protein
MVSSERSGIFRDARICEQDIEAPLLVVDASEEPIEIGKVRHVAGYACRIITDLLHCRLQFCFAAAGDEHIGALGDKPFRGRETDAAIAASDERYFSFKFSHGHTSSSYSSTSAHCACDRRQADNFMRRGLV